jgi:uncharacterized Zn finger protein
MAYWGFPRYVPVAEKRAKAEKKLAALRKRHGNVSPVFIEGSALAHTWWGKSWNRNLERYADYSNRIGRGRSYVRHGAVLDLQIGAGEVRALVQGSQADPYSVSVTIRGMNRDTWKHIQGTCQGRLGSLAELLAGRLPEDLADLFMEKGRGLFPSPAEIRFDCSCPDWASMCKHVAATLYGIGARLDEDPLLFFTLRKLDVESLLSEVVTAKTSEWIARSRHKSSRVLEDTDISGVFGIEVDDTSQEPARPGRRPPPKRPAERPARVLLRTGRAPRGSGPDTPPRRKKSSTASARGRGKPRTRVNQPARPGREENRARSRSHGKTVQDWIFEVLAEQGPASAREVARALRSKNGFASRSKNLEHLVRVLLHKSPADLIRKVGPGRFALAPQEGNQTDRVVQAIETAPGDFRMAQLQAACPSISAQTVRNVLASLRRQGRVECTGRGRYAHWRKTGGW